MGTFELAAKTKSEDGGAVATVEPKVWAPPAADGVLQAVFPGTFEVRVLSMDSGPELVAAIELVSPSNKDRPAERKAFAVNCASYLYQGISVIIVDIVTNRRANLHNEMLRLMEIGDDLLLQPETSLYAVAYQPLRRADSDEIHVWRSALSLGHSLPTLPLGLRADTVIPVDFEAAYAEACVKKRIAN